VASGWAEVSPGIDRDNRRLNDIIPLIRCADGRPYIPGSSIKGALRTAIEHHLLTSDGAGSVNPNAFTGRIDNKIKNKSSEELAGLSQEMEQTLLHRLILSDERNNQVPAKEAVTSVMKGIRVSDAFCTSTKPLSTCLLRKIDWVAWTRNEGKENRIALVRECFVPGTTFGFTLTIEPAITRAIGLTSAASLLDVARKHSAHLLGLLKSAFGPQQPSVFSRRTAETSLFLGGGSGFLDKTLTYSLAAAAEARKITAKLLDLSFAKHRHVERDSLIAPRTLKLGVYRNERLLMGACKLEQKP